MTHVSPLETTENFLLGQLADFALDKHVPVHADGDNLEQLGFEPKYGNRFYPYVLSGEALKSVAEKIRNTHKGSTASPSH